MKKITLTILCLTGISLIGFSQVTLDADGPGNTYEDITAVLAPGYDPVEEVCNHTSYGRHIDEIFDSTLNDWVFRFTMHLSPDNNKCVTSDRQRNEIKTYDQSPDNLKGIIGETVEYKWKFKLDAGFQSSPDFTHIHQLKSVGADAAEESQPLITLTTRYGASYDRLQLRYAETTSQTTIDQVDITPFKGEWVEVTELVTYGEQGSGGAYSITIRRLSDNMILMDYSDFNIRMWKTNADFIRPKWGIYRKNTQTSYLRDEDVLFADFSIWEGATLSDPDVELNDQLIVYPNPAKDFIQIESAVNIEKVSIFSVLGKKVAEFNTLFNNTIDIGSLNEGLYLLKIENETSSTTRKLIINR